jgi:hypothetical protein
MRGAILFKECSLINAVLCYTNPTWNKVGMNILRKKSVVRGLVVSLVCLLSLQLTGLSCLEEWWTVSSSSELSILSPPTEGGNQTSSQDQDACPCHFSMAQGEHVHIPIVWSPTPTTSSLPVTHLPLLVAFLFHPPVVA